MQADYYHGVNERMLRRVPVDAKRILDVGCAAGLLGAAIKSTPSPTVPSCAHEPSLQGEPGGKREVWGLEKNRLAAQEAKQRLDHVIVGDVEAMDPLPLPERYFECVICGDVLEHLREPEEFLRRLRKHLVPGATLIVNVPNIGHWSVIVGLMQGQFAYADNGLLDRTHLRFFTPDSLKDMLWEAGFLVTVEDALEVELRGASPMPEVKRAIGNAARALGIDPAVAEKNASIYQQLFIAKPVPDPYTEPEKMAALVGPHIGKLGPASNRASVVVLTYNSMKTIETCLNSVLPTLGPDDELILVDNASQDGTPAYLESRIADRGSVKLILNEENYGFSRGCNIGMLQSKGEYLILLNPDTQVWPCWIEKLVAPFGDPIVGAVGPLSNNVCGDQFPGLYLPREEMTSPDHIAVAVHAANSKPPTDTKLLIGFCLALRRATLDQVGLLEERCFLGADDLEISWRLRTLGHRLVITKDVFVSHETHCSFQSITSEQKSKAVFASDAALKQKLTDYYEVAALPTSRQLWSNDIFSEALSRKGSVERVAALIP